MTLDVQIQCINKTPRNDPHDRIQIVGGVNADGTRWKLAHSRAIEGIEEGKYSFHVSREGRMARLIIARSPQGHKYLKTENDGVQPDSLLSLPECQKKPTQGS